MAKTSVKTERRRKPRKRPPTLVYVELAAGNGGMMRDVNEEGCAVRVMVPLRVNEKTTFQFSLDQRTLIEGEALVLWTEENGRVAGLRFDHMSEVDRTAFYEWLKHEGSAAKREEAKISRSEPAVSSFAELREEIRSTPPAPALETANLPDAPAPKESIPEPEQIEVAAVPELQPETSLPPAGIPAATETVAREERPRFWPERSPGGTPMVSPAVSSGTFPLAAEVTAQGTKEADAPAQPEISSILIQPQGLALRAEGASASVEPLRSSVQEGTTRTRKSFERIRLSRASTILLLLILGAGTGLFHQEVGQGLIWLGELMGARSAPQPVPAAAGEDSSPPTAIGSPPGSEPVAENSSKSIYSRQGSKAARPESNRNGPSAPPSASADAPLPVTPLEGLDRAPGAANSSGETGQADYQQAMQILHRLGSSADKGQAVRLLWASVEKGNANAEVALANLYWHGDGVGRNCDQTRILLTAASRKGNGEAQKELAKFQREGCE